jgi:hypothetical protein|tara:strand:+ start:389 stop:754 length:366 start_codon:yes stop_codon:yes gene_type:complete
MKVLTTSASSQNIKIIPREFVTSGTLSVRDESTNVSYDYSITATTVGNYISIDNAYTSSGNSILKEGRFYNLNLKSGANNIYRDKIFVTDQTINQENNNYYDMNNGDYTTEDSFDNDYIIV